MDATAVYTAVYRQAIPEPAESHSAHTADCPSTLCATTTSLVPNFAHKRHKRPNIHEWLPSPSLPTMSTGMGGMSFLQQRSKADLTIHSPFQGGASLVANSVRIEPGSLVVPAPSHLR